MYICSQQTIGEFLPKSDTEPFENERYVVESRQKIGNSLVSEVTLTVHQKAVKILDRLVGVRELQALVELQTLHLLSIHGMSSIELDISD